MVAVALFNCDGDVRALSAFAADPGHGNRNPGAVLINRIQDWIVDNHTEESMVLVEAANPDFQVLIEFVAIESFIPDIDIGDLQRNRDRTRVTHRTDQLSRGEGVVALELDFADLHLGSFIDVEDQLYRVGGGNLFVSGLYHGELAPVLGEQFLEEPPARA